MKEIGKYRSLFVAVVGGMFLLSACASNLEQATPTSSGEIMTAQQGSEQVEDTPVTPFHTAAPPTEAPDSTTATETPGLTPTAEATPTRKPASTYADLEIITLLPPDAIPAINNPQFLTADEADEFYDPQELVMGVSFNGDARAYSAPFLSGHEIVNDTVGGVKIAVTW